MKKQFDIMVDNDNVDILDWINTHFENGNYHKKFEVTVELEEYDYREDGSRVYISESTPQESVMKTFTRVSNVDFYSVIEVNGQFRIGLFHDGTQYSANPEPYEIYEIDYPSREFAESVCKMLEEEAEDIYSEGQNSCY